MWRTLFDFLGDLGEGGVVFLVVGLMVLIFVVPMLINLARLVP